MPVKRVLHRTAKYPISRIWLLQDQEQGLGRAGALSPLCRPQCHEAYAAAAISKAVGQLPVLREGYLVDHQPNRTNRILHTTQELRLERGISRHVDRLDEALIVEACLNHCASLADSRKPTNVKQRLVSGCEEVPLNELLQIVSS